MYEVHLSQRADNYINKLDKNIKDRILDRLRKLATIPIPKTAKFIMKDSGDSIFRYRIGDFRAFYKVKTKEKIVLITKIDKRPRIYHR
ncbi:type II toxin-antitoxin system RelE/ParE family toxin [Nanoarchaeota archaeon]